MPGSRWPNPSQNHVRTLSSRDPPYLRIPVRLGYDTTLAQPLLHTEEISETYDGISLSAPIR